MFMLIGLGINAILLLMMFGVYSKLDDLSRAVRDLTRQTTPPIDVTPETGT